MPHFAYLAKPEPNLLIIIIVSFFIWLLVYYYFYFSFRIFGGLKVDWCRVLMDPCKFLVALSMHCSFTLCELKWALISMCNFLGFQYFQYFMWYMDGFFKSWIVLFSKPGCGTFLNSWAESPKLHCYTCTCNLLHGHM